MCSENNLSIGNAYKDYYTPPAFITTSGDKSRLPFKATLSKENAVAALKYLSFFTILTPFAVGIAHLAPSAASRLHQSARYGFEVVAFKAILPGQIISWDPNELEEAKQDCTPSFDTCKRTFTTADGVQLEGAYLPGKARRGQDAPPSAKTMIYFVGSGEHFAFNLTSPLIDTFRDKGYNIILFNYRGVGESTGHATKQGLINDGEAVYQYATGLGVAESDILLFGHSIGGGIASQVAVKHRAVKFCHERSFVSLDKAATSLLGRIAGAAIRGLGLNIDSRQGFNAVHEDNRLAVYHPDDEVITGDSSLHTHLLEEDRMFETMMLHQHATSSPHNRWITKTEAELIYLHFHPQF